MKKLLLVFAIFIHQYVAFSQDTLLLKNGDQIIGELKSLDRGVVQFETDYSDSDFKIEWDGVEKLSTSTNFLITLSNGERLTGSITEGDSTGLTILTEKDKRKVENDHIVYLKSVEEGFWSQVYANVDLGFSFTKAKNLRQITGSAGMGYLGESWSWDARVNTLTSSQDSVSTTNRTDGIVSANLFLPRDLFLVGALDFLSNTEQLLDLRTNTRAGLGYYVVHKNTWYWNFAGGVAYVNEAYSSDQTSKESMEGFIGTELNLFDLGDFSFFTKVTAYPGITEQGRFRTDFKMDLKYDLPLDFYIKSGLTVNYDNQPAEGATEADYVFNTGLGWEW
ncbi:MAG: DUF481 domain-containing protein [Salibacteraceae bacterium]